MDTFKNPDHYGASLIAVASGNPYEALKINIDAARTFPQVPAQFFADVSLYIARQIKRVKA